jgi:hypothetical protein
MDPVLTRCGYRCDLCLAYKPNIERRPSGRKKLSDGWHKYFSFRIPEAGIYCEGCREENPKLIDAECPVRPCVIDKGLDTCASCGEYVCEKLRRRIVTRKDVAEKRGADIPEDDYRCFILPYENFYRLEGIRKQKRKP